VRTLAEHGSAAALDVRGLTVAYGSRVALRDVSLALPGDQLLGLVGPNGSGKTTLIRAVSGVITPQEGSIRLDGADALGLSAREMALRVAVVSQNPHLPPAFTALELVLMGRTPHLRLLQG
jgi:iron complex transport system ATP-binding protein